MNFIEELQWRGMIHSMMPGVEEQLSKEMTTAYLGIDPTADSLHIGHLVGVMMLKHFQRAGHKPLALVGGATGMIGDPSGKSAERNLLTEETLRHNVACIKAQLARFLDFDSDAPNAAELVNNYDWMKDFTFLGFATTWIIGIVCSFFTAVFLTRLVYEHQMKKDRWLNLTFCTPISRDLMQNVHFPFMGIYKKTFTLLAVIIVVFAVSFGVRGLSRSIDFTGGRNYVIAFENPVEPEQVRTLLGEAFPGCTSSALALGTDHKTIRVSTNYKIESNSPTVDDEAETILFNTLKKANLVTQKDVQAFKNPDIRQGGSIISSTKVGPSVAKDITYGAIISVLIALVAIFLYILVRFRNLAFSVGSTIALAVDTVTVLGVYSLCWGWMPFSMEIDLAFIGAVLTVIGYSINDKVVVFDRIRENLRLHPKQDLQQLFNDSINQTLARTINTSLSTLIVLLCILFLGGESIRSFAFAMCLGVVVGTLSSIFVASPIAYIVLGRKIREHVAEEATVVAEK